MDSIQINEAINGCKKGTIALAIFNGDMCCFTSSIKSYPEAVIKSLGGIKAYISVPPWQLDFFNPVGVPDSKEIKILIQNGWSNEDFLIRLGLSSSEIEVILESGDKEHE